MSPVESMVLLYSFQELGRISIFIFIGALYRSKVSRNGVSHLIISRFNGNLEFIPDAVRWVNSSFRLSERVRDLEFHDEWDFSTKFRDFLESVRDFKQLYYNNPSFIQGIPCFDLEM